MGFLGGYVVNRHVTREIDSAAVVLCVFTLSAVSTHAGAQTKDPPVRPMELTPMGSFPRDPRLR